MPTGKLQGLRRKIVALIGAGGVVLAILGGGVAYLVEMRRLDGLVEQMARDQALHLVHALQSGQGMAGSPAPATGGFLYLRIEDGSGASPMEIRKGDMPGSVQRRLDALLATANTDHRRIGFTPAMAAVTTAAFGLRWRPN